MKRLSTLFSLLLLAVMSVWAEQVVLSTPSAKSTTLSDANGIITITDASSNGGGIQTGSGTFTLADASTATPMKLSGSRLFNLTYTSSTDITITKVTLYATVNKSADDTGTYTLGTEKNDASLCANLPKKTETPVQIDITNVTSLYGSSQWNAVIVVEYSSTASTLKVSPETLSFALNPAAQSKSATFSLTARNLTDGTYNLTVPTVDGLTVEPTSFTVASGSCDQEFTVTYASTADVAKAETEIAATVGDLTAKVSVSYQSRATAYTQSTVSADAAWDWSKLSETVELTAGTTPTKSEEFLLADLDDRIIFTEAFGDAMAIKMENMQFPSRGGYAQGSTIKFTTSVAGTIAVDFSNTGSNRPYRYLTVNGKATEFKTNSVDKVSATEIAVPAGEVVISCILDPNAASNFDGYDASKHGVAGAATMVRYYKIAFTPAAEPVATTATFNFADENFRENIGEKLADVKGNIYNETFTASGVSLQVTAGSAASKIYVDANRGQNLVTYKEYATLTFRAPEGMAITQIAFTAAGNSNIDKFTASSGAIEGMTWTGNADGVRFAQGGTSYLANAVVTLAAATSETATLADITYTECANIAAFNALAGGTYAKVTLTDAEVTGISADGYSTAWIQDATGGCWIQYCSLISQLKEKTKVNGTVYVVARSNSGNMQMKDAEGTPNSELTATDITDYTMVEGSLSVVNVEANKNKVVKITGASFVATGTNTGTLKQGVSTITVNNGTETANQQLHKIAEEWVKDETAMKGITIVAILVGKSATENQLLPISMEKETTTGITTVNATDGKVTIYNLQGVQQNKLKKGLNIVNGKKIVIK